MRDHEVILDNNDHTDVAGIHYVFGEWGMFHYEESKCHRDMFVDYQPVTGHEVVLKNISPVDVVGFGTVKLRLTTAKVLVQTAYKDILHYCIGSLRRRLLRTRTKDKADLVKDKPTNVVKDKADVVKAAVSKDKDKASDDVVNEIQVCHKDIATRGYGGHTENLLELAKVFDKLDPQEKLAIIVEVSKAFGDYELYDGRSGVGFSLGKMQGFEVIVPDKANMEHTIIPSTKAKSRKDDGTRFIAPTRYGTTQVQNDGKHSTDEKLIPFEKPNVSEIKDPALRQVMKYVLNRNSLGGPDILRFDRVGWMQAYARSSWPPSEPKETIAKEKPDVAKAKAYARCTTERVYVEWVNAQARERGAAGPIDLRCGRSPHSLMIIETSTSLLSVYSEQCWVVIVLETSMSPDLQRALENYKAYDMIQELKTMFEEQAKQFDTVKAFHACKQEDGQSVSAYILQMKGYLDTLECLGYAMPNMGKSIVELHAMLKLHVKGIPKKAETPTVLAIREGKIPKDKKKPQGAKGKDNGKTKLAYAPKPKISPSPKREHPKKDSVCHHYKEGIRESRKLKHGALSLYMENGMRAAIEAIESFDLIIPSGLIIDGIYEIDMHNLYLNVSSMFNISNKRVKYSLDSYYLWHCRLGHINKKHMDKIQRHRVLHLTHDESIEKCKSCIFGKMARKSFPHQVERAKDILRLIHTDVCDPFRTVSREGASYFITFTDDFSRYGYVYLLKHKHELTPPYTPQHNGVSGRRNRTLLDMVRSMMNLTTLPKSFWGYALKFIVRILNMVTTKKVERTPYEIWHGKALKVSYLRAWGCEALVKQDTPNKLNPRSIKCIFVGYPKETMEASGNHGPLKSSGSNEGLEIIQKEDTQPYENTSEEHKEVAPIEYELGDLDEPPNYKAALSDSKSDKWLEAMNTEMQSMKDNHVAKGYTQTYDVDYGETFSPVVDIRAIRILLAIAAFYDYEIWQMYVKTVFLNGHLSEDVYMVQPKGFVNTKHPNKVCKLQRFIYGLKQASRSWNKRLLMGNNVTMLQEVKSWLCKCFSMKDLGEATYILGIKIIRDISKRLIALSQSAYLEKTLKKFRMENSKKGYTLMIEKPYYRKSQGAKTPSEVKRMRRVPYASAIGSIMYAVRCARPDVAFAKNLSSRFQQNPGEIHWSVVKTILKYLRNTKDMVLVYGAKPEAELKVSCYTDATVDWNSAKQSTTAMSSTKAKYIAVAESSMEAVWTKKFIDGLVHRDDNVVVPLTKPMPFNKHFEHAMAIGIVPVSSLM
ncbi:retrotransposon protein, putative, ty1-copia subclass [Tanacetum coccineum]